MSAEDKPDCLCGHPYHTSGCSEIVPGYEYNESCSCDEYEPDMVIHLKPRPLSEMPQALVDEWAKVFSVELTHQQKDALVFQIRVLQAEVERAERKECAKVVEGFDGFNYKAASWDTSIDTVDEDSTKAGIAAAIRARCG